jgi:Tfp pilus assembly protein PilE
MKAILFFLVILLVILLPIALFSQTPDPGTRSQLLNYMRQTIDSQTQLVSPCRQIAYLLILAAVVTAIFGAAIAGLQNWSTRTWCRVTILILGLAIAGITAVTAIFPSYKQYFQGTQRANANLAQMKALALIVENTNSNNEMDKAKDDFNNLRDDITATLNELAGITKPAPAPLTDTGKVYLRPKSHGSVVTAEFRPNLLREIDLSGALASCFDVTNAIAFSPDPPTGSPRPSLVSATSCADFSGTWKVRTNDLTPMRVVQHGCRLEGRFDSLPDHGFRHSLHGEVLANAATITIERWDPSGCYTRLYGTMFIRDGILIWDITGSDGRCGIPPGYREHREWLR